MRLNQEQLASYQRDGFLLLPSFFAPEVVSSCLRACEDDPRLANGFAIWNYPEDSIYGKMSCFDGLVEVMEQILGGEVYHYQSKIMTKMAGNRGLFEWHQDYGYWYRFAVLYPLLASCMISLNGADRGNGCLQVLRGSHELGRLEHVPVGATKLTAEPERLEQAMERHELVHVEMQPGDALFFHCNILHSSAPNESGRPRWTLITCYNAARNDPYKGYEETMHSNYSPVRKVSAEELRSHTASRMVEV